QWRGVPEPLAHSLSIIPTRIVRRLYAALPEARPLKRVRSLFSLPSQIESQQNAVRRTFAGVRAVVAVCDWVRNTAIGNGAEDEKIVFSRHGLRVGARPAGQMDSAIPRFGFLGRVRPEKGVETLLR